MQKNELKIGFFILTHNREEYFKRCISSICNISDISDIIICDDSNSIIAQKNKKSVIKNLKEARYFYNKYSSSFTENLRFAISKMKDDVCYSILCDDDQIQEKNLNIRELELPNNTLFIACAKTTKDSKFISSYKGWVSGKLITKEEIFAHFSRAGFLSISLGLGGAFIPAKNWKDISPFIHKLGPEFDVTLVSTSITRANNIYISKNISYLFENHNQQLSKENFVREKVSRIPHHLNYILVKERSLIGVLHYCSIITYSLAAPVKNAIKDIIHSK